MCHSTAALQPVSTFEDNCISAKKESIARPQSPTSAMAFTSSQCSCRVSFNDHATIISTLPPNTLLTEEERCQAWYDVTDLDNFKTAARNLCRRVRGHHDDANDYSPEDCVRGLEQRISLERQRNKCLTVRCILKAQRRYAGRPDQLALIAAKCTAWAQQVAQHVAQLDYQHAYFDDDDDNLSTCEQQQTMVLEPLQASVVFPMSVFHLKRKCCTEADCECNPSSPRQVRARIL